MQQLIFILHILSCLGLIILVLVQHGKGADMGIAFGSGSANSFLGSQGSSSLLVKLTTCLAIIFFFTATSLTYIGQSKINQIHHQPKITHEQKPST